MGVDFWNADNTADLSRPPHTTLLGAGVLMVENLAHLAALPPSGFRLHAAPWPSGVWPRYRQERTRGVDRLQGQV